MDHLGPEPPRSAFGEYLRVLRQKAALTQGDLAERAGLTIDAIAALESGRRRHPYPHSVAVLATALSLSGDERRLFVRQAAHARFSQPAANAERPLSNVPTPLTTLIGRSHDAAALRGLLVGSSSRRLVTVVGVGGVGKTALAIRVAGELSSSFPDGVWLVELAPIADPVLVPKALSNVLGIADAPHILALRAIPTFLASKSVLLVLDNCEHLLEVCSELVEQVLAGCANVRVLATSREPFLIRGEQQLRLAPLGAPEPDASMTLDELSTYPAVQLFVERAQGIDLAFGLTAHNAPAIAQICSRLAGIPLAVELAAARLRLLTPAQILERLDQAFSLLATSSRTAPTRHQTLRAALDWSYDLLSESERTAFGLLAVFAGGFDLEAVATIGRPQPEGVLESAEMPATEPVVEWLTNLLNKSLVVRDAGERAPRYRLLEPVRQYAAERLIDSGNEPDARTRHANYYLALAEIAMNELRGPGQLDWVERLDRERDNLRAALRWADAQADASAILRLSVALVPYWEVRGHLSEGRGWLTAASRLAAGQAVSKRLQGRAMLGVGRLALWQSDFAVAEEHLNTSLTMSRQLGDQLLEADALTWLGAVRGAQGEFELAEQVLREALERQTSVANAWGTAWALWNLARAVGNRKMSIGTRPDVSEAVPMAEDSLRRFRALGDARFVAIACSLLGNGMVLIGDLARAGDLLREALAGLRAVGERAYLLSCLFSLAEIAAVSGAPLRAARLLGAAEAVSSALGVQPAQVNQSTETAVLRMIRPALSGAQIATARAEGRTLSLDEVVAQAWASAPLGAGGSSPEYELLEAAGGLSRRERQVARLLADGCSDRMIATHLGISVRTANTHVRSLLDKLDLRSRWQVADWARASTLPEPSVTLPA